MPTSPANEAAIGPTLMENFPCNGCRPYLRQSTPQKTFGDLIDITHRLPDNIARICEAGVVIFGYCSLRAEDN